MADSDSPKDLDVVRDPESLSEGREHAASPISVEKGNTPNHVTAVPTANSTRWVTVAGSWLILFATFGYLYAFGVYQDFYTRFFLVNHTTSQIAWIGSLQLSLTFLLGIVAGKLYDAGYYHTLQIFGSLIFTFSIFMLSLSKPFQYYQVFLSQGVGMGLGIGFTFVPTLGNISRLFYDKKALATGVALSGSSTGALIFPIMLNHLIPRIGFGPAVRASGYIVFGCLLVGNCLVRSPAKMESSSKTELVNIKSFFVDPPYVIAIPGALIALFGLYFPLIYIQLYAIEHGVNPKLAFYSIAIINGVSGVGRIGANFMADAYGPYNVLVPVTIFASAGVFLILAVKGAASLVVVSIFYGFFSGAWLSVALAALASLARSPSEVGARTGLVLALGSFGSLGSAPVQGALLGPTFIWWKATVFSGTVMVASAFFFLAIRQLLVRERGTQIL